MEVKDYEKKLQLFRVAVFLLVVEMSEVVTVLLAGEAGTGFVNAFEFTMT